MLFEEEVLVVVAAPVLLGGTPEVFEEEVLGVVVPPREIVPELSDQ